MELSPCTPVPVAVDDLLAVVKALSALHAVKKVVQPCLVLCGVNRFTDSLVRCFRVKFHPPGLRPVRQVIPCADQLWHQLLGGQGLALNAVFSQIAAVRSLQFCTVCLYPAFPCQHGAFTADRAHLPDDILTQPLDKVVIQLDFFIIQPRYGLRVDVLHHVLTTICQEQVHHPGIIFVSLQQPGLAAVVVQRVLQLVGIIIEGAGIVVADALCQLVVFAPQSFLRVAVRLVFQARRSRRPGVPAVHLVPAVRLRVNGGLVEHQGDGAVLGVPVPGFYNGNGGHGQAAQLDGSQDAVLVLVVQGQQVPRLLNGGLEGKLGFLLIVGLEALVQAAQLRSVGVEVVERLMQHLV